MAFLQADKIYTKHGLEIHEKLITSTSGVKMYSNRKLNTANHKPEYITIHNTSDVEEASGTNDAEQYARATYNNAMGEVVVHYYIDETACWHILADDTVGWHAADGANGTGNTKSLAIEIIMDGSGKDYDTKAEDRGALLAAILLYENNLPISKMVTHQHWSGKYCPAYILPHWSKFVATVEKYLNNIKNNTTEETKPVDKPTTTLKLFRIRKTWEDASSQIGAFSNLDKAKAACDAGGKEYSVFDPDGKKVYPTTTIEENKPETAPTFAVGDTVKLLPNAVYTSGKKPPEWLFEKTLYVRKINGENITISTLKTGDITGIINAKYLTNTTEQEFTPYIIKVTANKLNVRSLPSLDGKVVTIIPKGNAYTIVDEENGWGLLKSYKDKRNGWINLSYTVKI